MTSIKIMFLHSVNFHFLVSCLQTGAADRDSRKVFIIDEIGKMELFSQAFIRVVRQTLDGSSCTILGTIPVPKGKPLGLVEEVRSRRDVKVFTVSKNITSLAHWFKNIKKRSYLGQCLNC